MNNINKIKNLSNRGATLLEIAFVIIVVGVLAVFALSQYRKAVERSYPPEAQAYLDSVGKAQEVFYTGNNEYTWELGDLDIDLLKKGDAQ